MLKLAAAGLALAFMATSALAQNSPGAGQMTGPNSGAGVAGQPGNKSGPPAKSPSGTMGAGSSQAPASDTSQPQDASKIPGHPGSKSGPAAKSPSKPDGQ